MAKRALLVGCNYPGTNAELHGCVNDVNRMHETLVERFGFYADDITVMVDTDDSYLQPTGGNIKQALGQLIESTEAGDCLVLHYSGHGTRVPAESGDYEDDGYDEAIVPTDLNLFTDDDFRVLFNRLVPGSSFTFISDSCHSGGLIDASEEQIGGSCDSCKDGTENGQVRDFEGLSLDESQTTAANKSLSIEQLSQMLSERTGHDVPLGAIRTTLYEMFGSDSSPTVLSFVNHLHGRMQEAGSEGEDSENRWGPLGALATHSLQQHLSSHEDPSVYLVPAQNLSHVVSTSGHAGAKPDPTLRLTPDVGTLVSGCTSAETSADANPTGNPANAYGALSNGIQTVLSENPDKISNRDLVLAVRELLHKQGFSQHPCLYSSDENVDAPFICA